MGCMGEFPSQGASRAALDPLSTRELPMSVSVAAASKEARESTAWMFTLPNLGGKPLSWLGDPDAASNADCVVVYTPVTTEFLTLSLA